MTFYSAIGLAAAMFVLAAGRKGKKIHLKLRVRLSQPIDGSETANGF